MAAKTAIFAAPNPTPKPSPPAIKTRVSLHSHAGSTNLQPSSLPLRLLLQTQKGLRHQPLSAVQAIAVEEERKGAEEKESKPQGEEEKRKKLYLANLPWDFSAPQIEKLFSECGTVKDVEIIKQKDGRSRGFAFVTMASGEEACAAVAKLDTFELMGRIIRVEFAKTFRKPAPPPPPGAIAVEPRFKVYVSNLAWKARSTHLKEFFSEKFKPLSARVVFESPSGRSAGYGFVAFATKEEAEAAISELDGKELLGRPIRLKMSEKKDDESGSEPDEVDNTDGQSNEP